jgi:hypothetical protein
MIHSLEGAFLGVLSKVSSERGKEGEGRTWVVLAQIKIKFKYPKISKNIFSERQTICEGK